MLQGISFRSFFLAGLLLIVSPPGFAQVSVEDAWIREVPPGSPAAAVFMVISNASDKVVRVISMTSPIAKRVEWHDMKRDNGLMRMTQRKVIELPANGRVQLQPGGSHVMLLDMNNAPAPGGKVPVIFSLDNGQQLTVNAVVRKTDLRQPKHNHHH
ncbi:MAG: copper chaperone PCu(A)C [Moraxellaceae bacterium]|nr:copper chaperone PCu(A)C [Moraxellaceae bacterium]MDZ4298212.1 copper chaperone PCu(A)C [Moraxellaceae bacterium]MDZ4386868.1 copper chaperone PCu(A)C [Moraxellaceae bacterium]